MRVLLAMVFLALAGCGDRTPDVVCDDCCPAVCAAGFTCEPSTRQCLRAPGLPDARTADAPPPDAP